jgi:hypothetical protein
MFIRADVSRTAMAFSGPRSYPVGGMAARPGWILCSDHGTNCIDVLPVVRSLRRMVPEPDPSAVESGKRQLMALVEQKRLARPVPATVAHG